MTDDHGMITTRATERNGGDRHALARAVTRGAAHRIRRGVYVSYDRWSRLDADQRYLLRCRAECDSKGSRPILSHWSAAVVHGIPVIGGWPQMVHRLVERGSGGRSRNGVIAHPARLDTVDVVEIDGILVTSAARTVIDLAAASSQLSAVTAADFALSRRREGHLSKSELYEALAAAKPLKNHARVARILEFSTELADSPAESVSRVNMLVSGFVMPVLQSEYSDADGFIGAADFDWRLCDHLGEVDGKQKYFKPEYLHGRSPGQVVYEEKLREDRFRALPKKVSRWDWHCAVDPARLRAFLLNAGVPLRR
ncbi:type IV toxin-antitoxin system AbiEi family antitoxin domain-containing protein [Subtercola endophyticus]|uniref:type IV toxin-antitoxin system AbiEi family antitoxin domain-containing protein n=1 Tax=Subtercola endophyticus TaxID=2895559 RepID=UPI001E2A0993|nr:hypothetical protein [Subtercola endophyticus]UFS59202.1 hypothetical protein LQ955_19870 [Subtercola endophyticus]